MPAMKAADTLVLEAALKGMSDALNGLVGECMDEAGKPKAPDRKALMRARAMLPPACSHAFRKPTEAAAPAVAK